MAKHEDDTEVSAPAAKSGSKTMIIVAAIVLSSSIIGGGLFFGLKSHKPAVAAEAAEGGAAEGGEKKGEGGKHGEAKKKELPAIYPMEAFIVNIGDGRDSRYLKIKVELETTFSAEKVKAEIDPLLAPLRDSILVLLTTKTVQDMLDLAGKNKLREELLATVNKVIPGGKVKNVYFTDFVVQ